MENVAAANKIYTSLDSRHQRRLDLLNFVLYVNIFIHQIPLRNFRNILEYNNDFKTKTNVYDPNIQFNQQILIKSSKN